MEENRTEILSRQFERSNTAKLIATFFTGVAGAVVVPAIQASTDHSQTGVAVATWLFSASLMLAVAVFLLDTVDEVDYRDLEQRRVAGQWDAATTAREVAYERFETIRANDGSLWWMSLTTQVQLLVSIVACGYTLWLLY